MGGPSVRVYNRRNSIDYDYEVGATGSESGLFSFSISSAILYASFNATDRSFAKSGFSINSLRSLSIFCRCTVHAEMTYSHVYAS